ncbi:MAG: transglutaminase-like domain-containing protein, partial [Bacteroidaceae bacterium]|nr:transglutaminase-like domain-containing protein [Bacteroidaceae bacterium]
MLKRISLIVMTALMGMGAYAQKVTVRSSEIGKLTNTQNITELTIDGDMDEVPYLERNKFPNLERIVFNGNVSYLPGQTLRNWPKLETIEFRGIMAYTEGLVFADCPELRSVTFCGPIVYTSRWPCMTNCPKGEYMHINGLVLDWMFTESENCPNFKGYKIGGAVLNSENPAVPTISDKEFRASRKKLMPQLKQLSDWVRKSLASENGEHSFIFAMRTMDRIKSMMDRCDAGKLYADWTMSGKFADPDRAISTLDLLKKSAPYTPGAGPKIDFTYAQPSDSILTATRLRFNLDSVAGNGDELSRIKNLLHFVHEAVRHNGSAPYPKVPQNFGALYDYCKAENAGVNCRLMAIMLTEVLLAEGIPARYLTCLPRFYDTDSECHVIAVAWSKDLGKWIWVDPTFDAWVTDENGVMLGPSEVRSRLIAGQSLALNDYANWNHESKQTAEGYLRN